MPSIRIGFSTDLNLVNEQVGIGTTLPTARLDVRGQIRADNSSGSGGISTLTAYDGFLHSQQGIGNTISIAATTKGNLNSLSGEIVISSEVTVAAGSSIGAGRLDSLTVTGTFDLPTGGSANREETPEKGSTRFNQDLGQLEFYTGYEWRTVSSYDGSGRGRGVFAGGYKNISPSPAGFYQTIDYITISTTGNAINFGDLPNTYAGIMGFSDSTRGVFMGGYKTTFTTGGNNDMHYVTIASTGNSIDFGDLASAGGEDGGAASSSTRGIQMGGYGGPGGANAIVYVQIQTLGNALDFGDLIGSGGFGQGAAGSPTRCVIFSNSNFPALIETVQYASKGNATKFGDIDKVTYGSACSNSTKALFHGAVKLGFAPNLSATVSTIQIATGGTAQDFGNCTIVRSSSGGGQTEEGIKGNSASNTRGIFAGGTSQSAPTYIQNNTIEYFTISTSSNAIDFGDLTVAKSAFAGCSDSHGGLGGF